MEDHRVGGIQRRPQLPSLRGDSLSRVRLFVPASMTASLLDPPICVSVCLFGNVWVKFHACIAAEKLIKVMVCECVSVSACVCVIPGAESGQMEISLHHLNSVKMSPCSVSRAASHLGDY